MIITEGRRTGFTLLEIIVALAIAGLVLAALAQGFRYAARLVGRQVALRAESRTIETGWQDAWQALSRIEAGSRARPSVFVATPDKLLFTTSVPVPAQGGEVPTDPRLVDAELGLDDQHRLILRWLPLGAPNQAHQSRAEERVLAEGVETIHFEFQRDTASGVWLTSWTGPGIPSLVRLSLVWADARRAPWPPVIAGPAVTTPAE